MFTAPDNRWLVPDSNSFDIEAAPTAPPADAVPASKSLLNAQVKRIAEAQRILYADNRYGVLLVFQAMDAAGKDSTIRAVFSGVNPAGCHVTPFKQPSTIELEHDFLWRTTKALPERGRIGIFNRSYYEEVLVVRVHPQLLKAQHLPEDPAGGDVFAHRYESIRAHELHLARNGILILKFFLNVSRAEQRQRFLSRLRTPRKHWKFSTGDVAEAEHWPAYMAAYQDALNETSRPWAPWFSIPADNKPFMRLQVATIVADAMEGLGLEYPRVSEDRRAEIRRLRAELSAAAKRES